MWGVHRLYIVHCLLRTLVSKNRLAHNWICQEIEIDNRVTIEDCLSKTLVERRHMKWTAGTFWLEELKGMCGRFRGLCMQANKVTETKPCIAMSITALSAFSVL